MSLQQRLDEIPSWEREVTELYDRCYGKVTLLDISKKHGCADALLAKYTPIYYHKTWLCINNWVGCPSGCAYCILSMRNWYDSNGKCRNIVQATECVKMLIESKYFTGSTPIAVNNFAEPLLKPQPLTDTIKICGSLRREKTNLLGLISKDLLEMQYAEVLSNMGNILVLISYNELRPPLERIPSSIRLESIANAKRVGLPAIAYVRPLVSSWNGSKETIVTILRNLRSLGVDAIVLSGLWVTPEVKTLLQRRGISPPLEQIGVDKVLEDDVLRKFVKYWKIICPEIPLFTRTSCAVSYLLRQPDYNAHWTRQKCSPGCPDVQKERCASVGCPHENEVRKLLKRIDRNYEFNIDDLKVVVLGSLSLEDLSFLRHNLKFTVVTIENEHID